MFKIFVYVFFISLPVLAESIQFSEEKYYDALGTTLKKTGKIDFLEHSIKIMYDSDKTVVIYNGDVLITQESETKKELDLSKNPAVKMFFVLFDAIYFDNRKVLETYFDISETQEYISLKPHKEISSYIDSVYYRKTNKKLHFLQINLSNKDRIRIEETNETL